LPIQGGYAVSETAMAGVLHRKGRQHPACEMITKRNRVALPRVRSARRCLGRPLPAVGRCPGGRRARGRAPDRRHVLFPSRTPRSRKALSTGLVLSGPALALMIAAGGIAGTWSPGGAGPAARAAGIRQASASSLASSGTRRQVILDAYAAPGAVKPAISGKA